MSVGKCCNAFEVAFVVSPGEGVDVWDVHNAVLIRSLNCPAESVQVLDDIHLVISQNGLLFLINPSNVDKATLQIWNWCTGSCVLKCNVNEKISCFAVSSDGIHLACGSVTGKIFIWDIQNGHFLRSLDAHFKRVCF